MSKLNLGIICGGLAFFVGVGVWVALNESSGSNTWTIDDELRRGEFLQQQRNSQRQSCYARGGDRLSCDYR